VRPESSPEFDGAEEEDGPGDDAAVVVCFGPSVQTA
jgi:hypothetical protein